MMQFLWAVNLICAVCNLAVFGLTGDWTCAAVGAFGLIMAIICEGTD